jgi:hypothetical protein
MGNYCIIPDTKNNVVELTNNDCDITIQSTAVILPALPNHHNFTHFTSGDDPLTPEDIGAQNAWESPIFVSNQFTAQKGKHYIIKSQVGITPTVFSVLDPLSPSIGDFYVIYHEGGPLINIGGTVYSSSGTLLFRVYGAVGLSGQWKTQVVSLQQTVAKAWVSFNGTTTPITINSSYNVASITDNSVGSYTVNFSSPMANTNYAVLITARDYNSDIYAMNLAAMNSTSSKTINSVSIVSNYNRTGAYVDSPEYNVLIFGT